MSVILHTPANSHLFFPILEFESFIWKSLPEHNFCFPSTSQLVPAYLLSQKLSPVAGLLGGVLTGHVASGKDSLAKLPRILGDVGLIIHNPAHISQHICIWGQSKRHRARAEAVALLPCRICTFCVSSCIAVRLSAAPHKWDDSII